MRRRGGLWAGALVGLLLLLVGFGCGGGIKPSRVRGVVTLDGNPLPNAIVTFIPEAKDGTEARGVTDSDGAFDLSTRRSNDGAFPGIYRITVQPDQRAQTEDMSAQIGSGQKSIKDAMEAHAKAQKAAKTKTKLTIPSRYSDVKLTSLKETVPTDGKVVLELTSK